MQNWDHRQLEKGGIPAKTFGKNTQDHMRGLKDKAKEIKNISAKVLLNLKEPID